MRRGAVIGAMVGLLLALAPSTSRLEADTALPIDMGPSEDCLGAVPNAPTDLTRGTIRADVVVALDGISEARARRIMSRASEAYAPGDVPQLTPDVDLNFIAFHDLTGKLESSEVSPYVVEEEPQGEDLMSELIRYYHVHHPDLRRDHVHLLTDKDIYVMFGDTRVNAVLGIANCLGGVGTKYSYTISEAGHADRVDLGPLRFLTDLEAKTTAHEIGHAFGAHHHYANCVQFVPSAALNRTGDVCSLMFNDAEVIDLHFGAAEVAAVRGTAEARLGR